MCRGCDAAAHGLEAEQGDKDVVEDGVDDAAACDDEGRCARIADRAEKRRSHVEYKREDHARRVAACVGHGLGHTRPHGAGSEDGAPGQRR